MSRNRTYLGAQLEDHQPPSTQLRGRVSSILLPPPFEQHAPVPFGERAVFRGVCCQLVQNHSHRLGSFRFQRYAWTTYVGIAPTIWPKLTLDNFREGYAVPMRPTQQIMCVRQ